MIMFTNTIEKQKPLSIPPWGNSHNCSSNVIEKKENHINDKEVKKKKKNIYKVRKEKQDIFIIWTAGSQAMYIILT